MTLHIGIVGCSSEGAALCYRTICLEAEGTMGEHAHPEVSMHTHSLGEYVRLLRRDEWDGVASLMLSSAEKLVRGGADFLICPDNTIHQALSKIRAWSPKPWLHIAEVVAEEAAPRRYTKLGVLGTRFLMEGPVYRATLDAYGIESCTPPEEARIRLDAHIFQELVKGRFSTDTRAEFVRAIDALAKRGCDAVVLGCTEIPLLISPSDSPLPTLDSTRLLARAALRKAIGERRAQDAPAIAPRA
ncbi:aspartate/glutamate racemase family protein [Pendulispora albinea]|uniref:Amino acid racemase n=1 Tax=Pendulispora albinea TaxID=2741071 RepID=A0ABZ2MC22_9BACT